LGRFSSVVMSSLTGAGLLCRPTVDRPTDAGPELDCPRVEAVRTSPGLVATRYDLVVGFVPARELPNLWPNHPAQLLAMRLEELHDEVRR
jgi:hypothetical protein